MTPTRNNILFKPLPSKEQTDGGLYIPENGREIRDKGIVIKIGAWVKDFKEGDIVYRTHQWGQAIAIDNEIHFLMDAKALIAIE